MKKQFVSILIIFLISVLFFSCAFSEDKTTDDWSVAPVITKVYEQSIGHIYLEWTGNAPLYQIYLDGSKVADIMVNQYVLNVEKGSHSIAIYPIYEARNDSDTKVDLNLDTAIGGGGISFDLSSFGLDPKRLVSGNPSEIFMFDYKPSQIMNGTPENLIAVTDPDNRVVLSFSDQYNADEYLITIKYRNNSNYIIYSVKGDREKDLISKAHNTVSIILDPLFLQEQDCFIPELNEEYQFTVQLRKYGTELVSGEKIKSVKYESKVSGEYKYRVTAAWKQAPVITFASQTADGTITVRWDHEDYGIGCEYSVVKINKIVGIKSGEDEWGRTTNHEFTIVDLTNDTYCINVIPILNGEKGPNSADANVEIKNEWVIAPQLTCEQIGNNQVKLTWTAPVNIDKYHIIVSAGNSEHFLSFLDLDYSKYTEFDVESVEGSMEYIFTYDKDIDPDKGIKLKFEIYGIRRTSSGSEQKSATSTQTIVVK